MALFIPENQPTSVGPAGVIISIPIPADYRKQRISRILVTHTSGSLSTFSFNVSTSPLLNDPNNRITSVVNAQNQDTVDIDNKGTGYVWDGEDRINWSVEEKNVYIQIIPDVGTDNNFTVGIYIEKK